MYKWVLDPDDPERMEDEYFNPANLSEFWTACYQVAEYDEAADRLKALLAERAIELSDQSLAFRQLAARGMRVGIAAFREAERTIVAGALDPAEAERLRRYHDGQAAPAAPVAPQADPVHLFTTGQPAAPTALPPPLAPPSDRYALPTLESPLRQVYELYIDNKRSSAWKAEAEDDARTAMALFETLVGPLAVGAIQHAHAYSFREQILRLPKHHGRGRYKGMTPQQAIELAGRQDATLIEELRQALEAGSISKIEHDRKLSAGLTPRCGPKTVNKHVDYLGGCVKFLNKHLGWQVKNVFADQRFSKRDLRKRGRARSILSGAEMKQLFETPLFTGCASKHRRSLKGALVLKDELYWVPLIIAFTGGRLEEICQLGTDDVICIASHWCIRISDAGDDQEVKTESGRRIIPLHSTLLKLGLIDRVNTLRAKGKRRLFPELVGGGRYGRYGFRLTKRWTNYRRQVGLYEEGKDFHSLRHTFNTQLLNKKVPVVWMSQLMGHAQVSQTAGYTVNAETATTYFGGVEVPQLREAVEQFDFKLGLIERDGEWQITR